MNVILASASPRRAKLFGLIFDRFDVIVSDVDETTDERDPVKVTKTLSKRKALAVASHVTKDEEVVIVGSDTVVALDDNILGKPVDKDDAKRMLSSISGRTHMVYTGVTVVHIKGDKSTDISSFCERSDVTVSKLSMREIDDYLNTDEPYDKAGSYGIQGVFARYISGIKGDYFNIVGLPIHSLYTRLKDMGIDV